MHFRKLLVLNIIFIVLCRGRLFASDADSTAVSVIPLIQNLHRFHIDRLTTVSVNARSNSAMQEFSSTTVGQNAPKKSTLAAMGMSVILPGTGQLYAQKGKESLIKGAAFLVAEATGLALYIYNRNKGKKLERKYERFADQHWDVDKYLNFLEQSLSLQEGYLGRKSVGIEKDRIAEAEDAWGILSGVSVHHLYKNTRQQYYEMIYKYPEQFALGWSDIPVDYITPYPNTGYNRLNLTPLMTDYRGMRIKSNDYLSSARGMAGFLMINHVLSLTDAAWTVKRKNKEEAGKLSLSFRLEQNIYHNRLITMPTVRLTY